MIRNGKQQDASRPARYIVYQTFGKKGLGMGYFILSSHFSHVTSIVVIKMFY
jgi:hypothetical protein